ncbi:unnamed protein product [Ectocarpus sp. 8 AP-2014]
MCHILANENKGFKTSVFVCHLTLAHAPAPVPYSNVCRSPIAEGLAKKWLSERYGVGVQDLEQAGYKVKSRGCSTDFEPVGSPASPYGVTIMREQYGVDISAHRSAMLSEADVLEATHIYCMSRRHHDSVLSLLRRDAYNDHDLHSSPPLGPPPSSRASPGPPSPSALDAGTTGERGEMPFPVVVSVFEPEVPDPWHGTMEHYRECTGIISEAVTRAMEREAPGGSDGQQQPESSSTSPRSDEDRGKPQS